jgi:hypothetical protein
MTVGFGPHGTGKLRLVRPGVLLHWCPACNKGHAVDVHGLNQDGKVIGWDGDFKRPSFGQTVQHEEAGQVCTYLLTAGVLYYQLASTHALRGQSRHLEEFPL